MLSVLATSKEGSGSRSKPDDFNPKWLYWHTNFEAFQILVLSLSLYLTVIVVTASMSVSSWVALKSQSKFSSGHVQPCTQFLSEPSKPEDECSYDIKYLISSLCTLSTSGRLAEHKEWMTVEMYEAHQFCWPGLPDLLHYSWSRMSLSCRPGFTGIWPCCSWW